MDEYAREVLELKNLVTCTLEKKGVLAKIRAELRASVFETIEEEDRALENEDAVVPALIGSCNDRGKQLHASSSGKLMIALICEYMDWAQLGHTLKVYLPECNMPVGFWKSELREKFVLESAHKDTRPLLMEVLETYLNMEDSPGNFLKESVRSTSSATESASTASQDEPASIVEKHSRWSSPSLSGNVPPLGRKGVLSMIEQSSVGSLHNFSHTNTAADHMADANSSDSFDMIYNVKASCPTSSAGTLKDNNDLETLKNEDHDWRYDDEGHSKDVLQTSNALNNIQLDKRTHNSTNSWRNIEEEFIEEEIQSERENF